MMVTKNRVLLFFCFFLFVFFGLLGFSFFWVFLSFILLFFQHIISDTIIFSLRKGIFIMRNAVRKMENRVTTAAMQLHLFLDDLDRRTDLSTSVLQKMALYDEDNDFDDGEEDLHFGLVRLGLTIVSVPIFLTAVSTLLLLL